MPEKKRSLNCLLIVLARSKSARSARSSNILDSFFNKTIIRLVLVGYELIIANIYHLISDGSRGITVYYKQQV